MQNLIRKIFEVSKKSNLINQEHQNFEQFVKDFYFENKLSDFDNYSVELLFNISFSAYKFLQLTRKDGFNLRIYNPQIAVDGFESKFTIIEINNNDMPFLVDSTVAFLDKQGIAINNIIHPVLNVVRDKNGKFIEINNNKNSHPESLIQLHIDKIINNSEINLLLENLTKIIDSF
ncbi:MAG: hypothetical protein EBS92_02620 [Proteobacteria bacterium]|nr:hypothetical protein [Pseudomonadota bacterium]